MNVLWIGSDLIKAYHDPHSGRVDVIASRIGDEGAAWAAEAGLAIVVDESGAFCTLEAPTRRDAPASSDPELLDRPADCLSAVDAEVELSDDAVARWDFDSTLGRLRVQFDGVEASRWGRLGDNLIWLALDSDARLAAIVVEGVSRDPGGAGQAAWLEELGVG